MGEVVDRILGLVGRAVLSIEDLGKKGCFYDAWPELTWQQTQDPETELVWLAAANDQGERPVRRRAKYLAELAAAESRGGNLSVVLKDGLCAIDIDNDDAVEPFLSLNPGLRQTLITRGSRGVQIWVRCRHDEDLEFHGVPSWPKLYHIKDKSGQPWGEWRTCYTAADGSFKGAKSTIWGQHPDGMRYEFVNEVPVREVYFRDICWPADIGLPWEVDQFEALVRRWGPPWVAVKGMIALPTEAFWAGRAALRHQLIFEAMEERFYLYEPSTGVWRSRSDDEVKAVLADDLMDASRDEAVAELSQLGEGACAETWKCLEKGAIASLQTNMFRSNTRLGSIVQLLRGLVAKRGLFEREPGIVHVKNGMIDLRQAAKPGGSVRLEPFSPRWYSRNQIPVDFVPGESCPELFERLLKPGYTVDEIKMLQRWVGQCVLGRNKQQVMMIIVGEGGNGKSTIIKLFQQFIGEKNVMELRTKQLDERFEMYFYVGKTFLAGVDVDGNFLQFSSASSLKKLTGDDLLHAECKGVRDAISFRGSLNIGISCNSKLKVRLKSDHGAWKRRLCIAECKAKPPRERIEKLEHWLIDREGPGILNWALRGAIDVLQGMPIRHSSALDQTVDDLINESDSVKVFAEAKLHRERGSAVPSKHLYNAYIDYCEDRGWEALSESDFLRAIRSIMSELFGASLSSSVEDPETKRQCKGYRGVNFNHDDDNQEPSVPDTAVPDGQANNNTEEAF